MRVVQQQRGLARFEITHLDAIGELGHFVHNVTLRAMSGEFLVGQATDWR